VLSDAPQLLLWDESVGKIRAAVKARGDSDLAVVGRTSAVSISNVDDAIARLKAFKAVGVDALMLPGLKTRDDLDRISAAVKLPLVVGGIVESLCDPAYLASRNVRLWSSGHQTFSVAVKALYDAMKAVRDGMPAGQLPATASKELMNCVTGAADYKSWTKQFLGGA
jgi:carboxyvinyl-carboxyphosphonate phosphorylmutase